MANVYAGQYGPEGLEYPDTAHVIMQPVTVLQGRSGNTLAVIYADRDKTALAANPVFTDSIGNLTFLVEPGLYRLKLGDYEIPVTVADDPAEPSADLTEELINVIVDNASDEVLESLEPPVNLTLWFENQLA